VNQEWNIRSMRDSEADAVSQLATDSFISEVAPLYSREGIESFTRYATPDELRNRLSQGNGFIVAEEHGELVGMAELRGSSHLAMLFVADRHRRRGIGRALVHAIIRECTVRDADVQSITVNSAPNSVDAYVNYGFTATGPEQEHDGIRFVPMRMPVGQEDAEELGA
jgi:GNAT superfamily N-acetyltransferase